MADFLVGLLFGRRRTFSNMPLKMVLLHIPVVIGDALHTGPKRHIIPAFLMSPTRYNISAKGLPWAGQDSDLS